jgi:hypothetical protein
LGADTLLTMPWESWVTWDLLQKSTNSAHIEKSVHDYIKNRLPLKPSFYKQRQPMPPPSITLLGLKDLLMSEDKSSNSLLTHRNPVLDPACHPLP